VVNNGVDPLYIMLPVQFRNDMKGNSYGFEAATSWSARPNLKITANYSYQRMSLDSSEAGQEAGEDQNPISQLGMRASWNISDAWTLDVSANYVDEIPDYNINAYTRVDMNLGWKLAEGVRFNLVGQNLLSSSHREYAQADDLNAAEIERSVYGKLTWQF
jgi:iron complex outermembrane recepter protein